MLYQIFLAKHKLGRHYNILNLQATVVFLTFHMERTTWNSGWWFSSPRRTEQATGDQREHNSKSVSSVGEGRGTRLGFLSVPRTQNCPCFLNRNEGHEKVIERRTRK